jgi:hypothetical protein
MPLQVQHRSLRSTASKLGRNRRVLESNMGGVPQSFRSIAPKYGALCLAIAVTAAPIGTACAADELLGLYIGGSVGRSDMHLPNSWTATFAATDEVVVHHTGWTASVGFRPLQFVGAELQYLDFGKAHWSRTNTSIGPGETGWPDSLAVHTNAEALAAVLYAPIPVRFFDVYAKVGPARWHSTVNGKADLFFLLCPASLACGQLALKQDGTDLVYGVGLQFKLGPAALRAEYERIEANPEYPYLYDLGLTWTF